MDSHLTSCVCVCVADSNILLPGMNNKLSAWDLRSSSSLLNTLGSPPPPRVSPSFSLSLKTELQASSCSFWLTAGNSRTVSLDLLCQSWADEICNRLNRQVWWREDIPSWGALRSILGESVSCWSAMLGQHKSDVTIFWPSKPCVRVETVLRLRSG